MRPSWPPTSDSARHRRGASARHCGPRPPRGRLATVVGGDESEEFRRQSALIASAWGSVVVAAETVAGRNHMDVLHEIADPHSRTHALALELLGIPRTRRARPALSSGPAPVRSRPRRRQTMKSTMMPVQLSTNQILDRAGTYFGDQEVLGRLPDKSTYRRSYREIRRRARQLAQALRDKAGIARGDPVATMSWNHAWHLESYFGIPAAGAVLHTLNLRLSPEDIAYIMDDAGDRVLIVDDVLLPIWERVSPLLRQQPRVIVVPFSGAALPAGLQSYEDFIEGDATGYRYPEQDENEAVGMCYTSGTTGRPKAWCTRTARWCCTPSPAASPTCSRCRRATK